LPPIDPIFQLRFRAQRHTQVSDARRRCISAEETDEILAGLDVIAQDISPASAEADGGNNKAGEGSASRHTCVHFSMKMNATLFKSFDY
jgi:hypothetical protein